MKKLFFLLGFVFGLSVLSMSTSAQSRHPDTSRFDRFCDARPQVCRHIRRLTRDDRRNQNTPHAVPEIDTSGAAIAFAFTAGVILIVRELRKKI